jgi:hypothetical protein
MSQQPRTPRTFQTFGRRTERLGAAFGLLLLLGTAVACDVSSSSGTHAPTSTIAATASQTADQLQPEEVQKNNDATLATVKTWLSNPQALLNTPKAQGSRFTNGAPYSNDYNTKITYPTFAGITQRTSTGDEVYYPSSKLSPNQKNRLSPAAIDTLLKNGAARETEKVVLNLGVIENDQGLVTAWAGGYQLATGEVTAVWYDVDTSDNSIAGTTSLYSPAAPNVTDLNAQLKSNVGSFLGIIENNDLEVMAYYATQANPTSVKKAQALAQMIATQRQFNDLLLTGNKGDLTKQSVSYGVYKSNQVVSYTVDIGAQVLTVDEVVALPTSLLHSGALIFAFAD